MALHDKISNIAFWIMLPSVRLTEKDPRKWVRVLGFFAMFPLFPLMILGMPLLMVSMFAGILEDI